MHTHIRVQERDERRTQLESDQTLMIASWPIVSVIVIVLVHVYDLQLQSVQLSTEYDMDVVMRACVVERVSVIQEREDVLAKAEDQKRRFCALRPASVMERISSGVSSISRAPRYSSIRSCLLDVVNTP